MSNLHVTLSRIADTADGVFGVLDVGHERFYTAEEEWLENQLAISCIPATSYRCVRSVWQKYQVPTFEITGVAGGRSRILFHYGNTEEDTKGCILIGSAFGSVEVKDEDTGRQRTKWGVVDSRAAFGRFMVALKGVETFTLSIRWCPPGGWRK